ncbi:helix-turn-helix domain-containing protein [Allokutzneria albata]|uniref:DNA-binding transcriptional regulator, MerR family n=1 Tax=Allokutzneria albata TaxID=211114 RepID=A0A1H0A7J3_ALLAB|nr:MerR family transcriptional regulator [Allokutzneria albata]SDN29445.1 DNA-binding transcriptional regulator, MerR family [Allokutzneria albata]
MLTIGELARLAGTTVRAVRHYTAEGLIAEPPRDASGYRRYGTRALITVSRIRRLRDLGLSLDQIRGLLDGKPRSLDEALSTLDEELAGQERRIAAQRKRIAELRSSDEDPEIPGRLGELLRGLEAAGADEQMLRREKEAVLLITVTAPEGLDQLTEAYQTLLGNPADQEAMAEFSRGFQALADLPEDSPEVERLAEKLLADNPKISEMARAQQPAPGPSDALFLDFVDSFAPAQRRFMYVIAERVAERGGQ